MDTTLPEHEAPTAAHDQLRILVVEDDLLLARTLTRVLTAAGADVTLAQNGLVATQMIKVRAFDVLLTDVQLPQLSGLEVARCAREVDQNATVIMMTGSPNLDTAVRAVELGAYRYLIKPTPTRLLVETVQEAARLSRARHQSSGTTALGAEADEVRRFEAGLERLWMAYQPLVRADGSPYGHEALVRSDEPSMRNPALLLDTADRLRRLHDLGRRIRRAVGDTLTRSGPDARVLVNLHPLDLLDDAIFELSEPLLPHAHRVVLELTERASFDELPDAETRVERLRRLGFQLALDDLGAGYAGLSTLARLSPDVVKLDMSLIRGVDTHTIRQKLVRMVTAVSHDLGALVVAEGIETPGERETAIELGCDVLQGYLLGRPDRLSDLGNFG
jgi:EAL domain-containing protein (putative c-di-GMP-specific phosphodiesterase class I)/CheY-like chemotaxis protein